MPITYGRGLEERQEPLYEEGLAALRRILGEEPISGIGEGLFEGGGAALTDLLSGMDPAFIQDIYEKQLAPMTREFEEETIPGIREAMVGAGDFWSTGRANLETEARERFAERMESMLGNLMLQGRQQAQAGISQVAPFVSAQREAAIAPEMQELQRLREALPWLELPAEIAWGEPTGAGGGGIGGGGRGGSPSRHDSPHARAAFRPVTLAAGP